MSPSAVARSMCCHWLLLLLLLLCRRSDVIGRRRLGSCRGKDAVDLSKGFSVQCSVFSVQCSGFRVQGRECSQLQHTYDSGSRVEDSGFRVPDLEVRGKSRVPNIRLNPKP